MTKYRSPQGFPAALRWSVEVDYLDKLSKSEKDWLGEFNEWFSGGNPFPGSSQEEKRRVWREQKQRQNCVLSRGLCENSLDDMGL